MTLISKWHPRPLNKPPKAISVAHDQEIGGYSGSCSCADHAGGHREFLQGLHWAKSSRGAKGVTSQSSPKLAKLKVEKVTTTSRSWGLICCGDLFFKNKAVISRAPISKAKKTKLHFVAVSDRGEHLNLKQTTYTSMELCCPLKIWS